MYITSGLQAVAERKEIHILARVLARAENEKRMGFPDQEFHSVAAEHPQDNAERIKNFRLIQVKKDEKQLYVPDVHRYIRSKYASMVVFTRDCERMRQCSGPG